MTLKRFKSPFSCVIFPLTQPQVVANQNNINNKIIFNPLWAWERGSKLIQFHTGWVCPIPIFVSPVFIHFAIFTFVYLFLFLFQYSSFRLSVSLLVCLFVRLSVFLFCLFCCFIGVLVQGVSIVVICTFKLIAHYLCFFFFLSMFIFSFFVFITLNSRVINISVYW